MFYDMTYLQRRCLLRQGDGGGRLLQRHRFFRWRLFIVVLYALFAHRAPEIICLRRTGYIGCCVLVHRDVRGINILQEAALCSRVDLSVLKAASGIADGAAFLRSGECHVKQTALLFQPSYLRFCHPRGEKILLHSHHKHMIELKTLGRVDSHQGHLLVVGILVGILIGQQ